MTKVISIVIIALLCLGGWELYQYWQRIENEKVAEKEAAASVLSPDQLPGLPAQWDQSLRAAQAQGAAALGTWLKAYGRGVQDPRKAWIELDYCVMIARENPAEARRVFAEVKSRTPQNSPVWPRVHQLQKTYD